MSTRPPPPSAFARTASTSSVRTSSSQGSGDARLSAIFVGKIPVDSEPSQQQQQRGSRPSSSSSQHARRPSLDALPSSPSARTQDKPAPSTTVSVSSAGPTFQRPPRSTRRPSLQNGLPSPPFTSSEGSGGSTKLQHPPAQLREDYEDPTHSHTRPSVASRGQSEEEMDQVDLSLELDGAERDRDEPELSNASLSRRGSLASQASSDRDQRIKNIKDRVKNIDDHAPLSSSANGSRYSSSATPSPTRSSYKTPPSTAALSASTNSSNSDRLSSSSNRRSSLPAPPPTSTTSGRAIRPPLKNDSAWSASGGEETERERSDAHSRSSGASSRAHRPEYSRAAFSGSSAGGEKSDYKLPTSLHSPSHDRASSLDLGGSDGGLSRRSSRSGGGRTTAQHAQSHSLSSIDTTSSSPPPTPINPRSRDSPSLRTTALARSQSSSTSGSGQSSSARRPALLARQSSDFPVDGVLGATTIRSRTGSPVSGLVGALSTLRISPSVRASRGSLASIAAAATANRNASPSPRSQRQSSEDQPPPSATRSTLASRQARTSSAATSSLGSPFAFPDKELNGRSETVGRRRNGGETSRAGREEGARAVEEDEDRKSRERQSSGGKKRAPLPMEFRNDGASSPPPAAPRNPRITTTAPAHSETLPSRRSRENSGQSSPEPLNVSAASTVRETSSRVSRAQPPSRSRTILEPSDSGTDRPRYTRRGGSAESALAERDNGKDLFSTDKNSDSNQAPVNGTREILERIERETAEREIKKRQLLESQALRRAESSMALDRDRERPESSMSTTEDFNRRFPPRTPIARLGEGSRSIRQTPQTVASIRPSTSMAHFDDAPRTAPVGGHQLRSNRSIYNLQSEASRQETSPSPSQQLRSRTAAGSVYDRSGTPTRASTFDRNQSLRRGAQTPTYHARASTSVEFPTSSSTHSNLSGASSAAGSLATMVSAFQHVESTYSPLNLPCTDNLLSAANSVMSKAEQTNTSIAQVLAYTHQQIVDGQIDNLPAKYLAGLHEVQNELKDAKKTSDEEIRQLGLLFIQLPKLGRELISSGGGMGSGSDGGRDDSPLTRVRSRHSSLEKAVASPLSRNESRRSVDFHSRDASDSVAGSRYGEQYSRPSTSQAYALTTSPSSRFNREPTRPRLASIPSVRQFTIDAAKAAADSSASSTVPAAPFPRHEPTSRSGSPAPASGGSPHRPKRTSVLGHVFDRFSTAPQSTLANGQDRSPDRTWRQNKVSSTSTVRATSLFPVGPKVSEPTTAVSNVTANKSPTRSHADLPAREYDDLDETPPAPSRRQKNASSGSGFLARARTITALPSTTNGHSRRRTSFADEDEEIGEHGQVSTSPLASRRTSQSTASGGSEESRRRRQSLPPGAEGSSPASGGSMFRRLGSFVGGSGAGGDRLSPERRK